MGLNACVEVKVESILLLCHAVLFLLTAQLCWLMKALTSSVKSKCLEKANLAVQYSVRNTEGCEGSCVTMSF